MLKTIGGLLLLVLTVVAANAETYRCRMADGRLIFTDDPGKFPSGCREMPAGEKKGGASFVPSTLPPAKPIPPAEPPPGEEAVKDESAEKRPPTLKEQAVALAEEYRELTSRRIHSLGAIEARKVRGRIGEVLKKRDDLRQKVASSGLGSAEKAEIEQILAGIGSGS